MLEVAEMTKVRLILRWERWIKGNKSWSFDVFNHSYL